MTETAFVGVGKKKGLELWRIEKLKPVKMDTVSTTNYYFHNIQPIPCYEVAI